MAVNIQTSVSPQHQQDPHAAPNADAGTTGEKNESALAGQGQISLDSGSSGDGGSDADTGSDHGNGHVHSLDQADTAVKPALVADPMLRFGAAEFIARGGVIAAAARVTGSPESSKFADGVTAPETDVSPDARAPMPMPKPGSNGAFTATPNATVEPTSPVANGASVAGGHATAPDPTLAPAPIRTTTPGLANTPAPVDTGNYRPYLYPGLHTSPDQSPHYAVAAAYGKEHGYSDDEVMKLAVLMQSNRDQNGGREWLALKPDVLRAAVNAVTRNPDNSFDTSGVFGGRRGYSDTFSNQRVYTDPNSGVGHDANGTVVGSGPYTPPPGWVLEEERTTSSEGGDIVRQYYRPGDDLLALNSVHYLPLDMSGYIQVRHGAESMLSVGADGGYHDLSRIEFDPEYGLITTPDNYRPFDTTDWTDTVLPGLIFTVGGAYMGALAGLGTMGISAAAAFTGTLGTTLDLREAFRAGVISFVSGSFAQWLTPYLTPNLSATNVIRQGVQGLLTSFTAGALQGDARQGLVNGLASFLSVQIAGLTGLPLPVAGAIIRGLRDPNSALTTLLTDILVGLVTNGAQGIVLENDMIRELQRQYPELSDEQARSVVQRFIAAGREVRDINNGQVGTGAGNGKPPFDADIQQQITWMRNAIDSGQYDTAAEHFNNIVERRAAANPTTPRTDIANQLLRELSIAPDMLGFVVGANGTVTVAPRVDRPTG
jgi:hypothetical protein